MTVRRRVLRSLGVVLALAAGLRARAQSLSRTYRVAWIGRNSTSPPWTPGSPFPSSKPLYFFRERLAEVGFANGRNLEIRTFMPKSLAARDIGEIVHQAVLWKADVIQVRTVADTRAARGATATTPIVFSWLGDPVESGLVASLARPGGNATGVALHYEALSVKRLELMRELVPKAARIALIYDRRTWPGPLRTLAQMRAVASQMGIAVEEVDVASMQTGLEGALNELTPARADAVLPVGVINDAQYAERFAEFQQRTRVPVIDDLLDSVERGVVLAVFEDQRDHFRRAADIAAKILNGAAPSEVPVDVSTRIQMVVNAGAARRIGISLSGAILARADRVIE